MYLSHLLIDVGNNPDRSRPGRLWLRNIYHVHQRLSMAFPSAALKADDPLFLGPYDPSRFERPKFLFRIENTIKNQGPSVMILVQCQAEPDWGYAFKNAPLLAAPPEVYDSEPRFPEGEVLRFRIRVNPTKKSKQYRQAPTGTDSKGRPRSQGRRVALTWGRDQRPDDVIGDWFAAKGERAGFAVEECQLIQLGWVIGYKPQAFNPGGEASQSADAQGKRQIKFRSALVEGRLTVTDADAFRQALAAGIGPAKAFGFGLLSVARARPEDG